MRTQFAAAQLGDPHLAEAEKNLRACMHCGICTATCPTYVLLGDERDGPRGRIVMMQKMLEQGGAPSAETVLHVDRCLSCLACRTACPSSVDYARLVDLSRAYIEDNFRRPLRERLLRWMITETMSKPSRMRFALRLARWFSPFAALLPGRMGVMGKKGARLRSAVGENQPTSAATANRTIAILAGCVQAATAPEIDQALSRTMSRRGCRTVMVEGCCGSLAHHLGQTARARRQAEQVIAAFESASCDGGVDVIVASANGCVAHLKDYPHLFQGDGEWQSRAERFARSVHDVSNLLPRAQKSAPRRLRVAFHSACSAQNGLRLAGQVEALLVDAGFDVMPIPEGHLCCGSAGSYSLLQPEISGALRSRKLSNIRSTAPDVVATGNIGCLLHLSGPDAPPVVHYVELLDWAEGGNIPHVLKSTVERPVSAR
jgi:glycolate dehydrogenase iron-sulfur subunit